MNKRNFWKTGLAGLLGAGLVAGLPSASGCNSQKTAFQTEEKQRQLYWGSGKSINLNENERGRVLFYFDVPFGNTKMYEFPMTGFKIKCRPSRYVPMSFVEVRDDEGRWLLKEHSAHDKYGELMLKELEKRLPNIANALRSKQYQGIEVREEDSEEGLVLRYLLDNRPLDNYISPQGARDLKEIESRVIEPFPSDVVF